MKIKLEINKQLGQWESEDGSMNFCINALGKLYPKSEKQKNLTLEVLNKRKKGYLKVDLYRPCWCWRWKIKNFYFETSYNLFSFSEITTTEFLKQLFSVSELKTEYTVWIKFS